MSQQDTESLYDQFILGNYGKPALTIAKGEGEYLWDDQGNRYLDFGSGIAVNALGHCHPAQVKAISEQAASLIHCSNLYRNEKQAELAQKLASKVDAPGKLFFCNSGAEANEALIKLSRLFGLNKSGEEGKATKIIVAEKAFHGRTFGGMSATPQEKIQKGFRPLLPNVAVGTLNDLESFASQIDDNTAAIFLEPIQGEGGIHVATPEFLQGIRKLCDEHNILLMLDEVQCGIARSGHFFSFEEAGIIPDAIGMAKGIAGGFPMGAVWIADKHAPLFTPGSHGSTFGGTPLACAAALAVLDTIDEEDLVTRVQTLSKAWIKELKDLQERYPVIQEVRGKGYLIGLDLKANSLEVVGELAKQGLITVPSGPNVVRLIPPLTVSKESLHKSVQILESVLSHLEVPL